MSKEAMKKALDALVGWKEYMPALFDEDDEKAITALREALANEALDKMAENAKELGLNYAPAQRTWVGLTDEEIDELYGSPMELEHSGALKWVRVIEAKLKEKNT